MGMHKLARRNNEPEQVALAHLLIKAGNGNDEELLAFVSAKGSL